MGLDQLASRWQTGLQLIQTNGITYNIYGDPRGKERSWSMDPIPMVLDGREWDKLEAAVAQRATLLNAILSDLYGEQRLVRDKRIPASLLFGNSHFLRPCFGIVPPKGIHLHSYAADLARSPDGNWWVISDRTQAPSGTGYALENRLVSARTLSGIFDQCRVKQLHGFFDATRDALLALAPNARTNPRVVLLTPGPYNETYFEHSFLARHWSFPLVEGADLTVRDNRVYLKTLAGLEQVDLILRRLDDGFCDPLELRGDSVLGVPGLLRRGPRRQCGGRQRPGQRPAGNFRASALSSRSRAPHARGGTRSAFCGHLVVRTGEAAPLRAGSSGSGSGQVRRSPAPARRWNSPRRWTREPGRNSPAASKPTRNSTSRRSR